MKQVLCVVLVAPRGDANIGAVARAMKNFGLTDLRLVNPAPFRTKRSYLWAVGARDLLAQAKKFESLDEALADTSRAVAFTRRIGKRRKRSMDLEKLPEWMPNGKKSGTIALVFGREDKGLTNAEIRKCDAVVSIQTSGALPSLNLSQAVLLACHCLTGRGKRRGHLQKPEQATPRQIEEFADRHMIASLMGRFALILDGLGYDDAPRTGLKSKILHQLKRLFGRGGLTTKDIRMFEGLISRMLKKSSP